MSRITIRNALSKLIEEGFILPFPGKGNYVLPYSNDKFIVSINPQKILKDKYNKVELLSSHIIKPNIYLVYYLHVHPDSRVVEINWRLLKDDIPVAYDVQYIPYFPGITLWKDDFEYTSFSEIIKKRNDLEVTHEEIEISAIKCKPDIAGKLKIKEYTPVMVITQKSYSDEESIGLRRIYIRKEWCKLVGKSQFI